jgi:transcriptional regulator with XRE-family HTH domain
MIPLGKTARYLRAIQGLSQREAARQLGISVVHLCNIENDKSTPSPALLDRFRELWGIDLYVLSWCRNGDIEKLPPAVRESSRALAEAWQKQLNDLVQSKKRSSLPCSTSDK